MKTAFAACLGINLTIWAIVAHLNLCQNNNHDVLHNPTTTEAAHAPMQKDHVSSYCDLGLVDPLRAR